MNELTQSRLKELLQYDPETGDFVRISRSKIGANRGRIGVKAGDKDSKGYWRVGVNCKRYLAHRLAWFYMTGVWPKDEIDHINGVRTDNRFSNLREATSSENKQNMHARRNSNAGLLGVVWVERRKKWQARIQVSKWVVHLGTFLTAEEAHEKYAEAKAFFHQFSPTVRVAA